MKTKITNISKVISWNTDLHSLEVIKDKDILIEFGRIIEISNNIVSYDKLIDAKQSIVTPGFIDSHTHPIFIGNRSNEFIMRANGKTYKDIRTSTAGY